MYKLHKCETFLLCIIYVFELLNSLHIPLTHGCNNDESSKVYYV